MERARRYGLIAAAMSAAQGGFELVRLVTSGVTLPGYSLGTTLVMAITFVGVALAAAVGLVLRHGWGWIAGWFGALGGLGYGVSALAGGTHLGAAYVFLGFGTLYCLGKSLPAYRTAPAELAAAAT